VEAALEHDDRPTGEEAEEQPTVMAGRGRGGPTRQVLEGDRDRRVEPVGQAAGSGSQDDARRGGEGGAVGARGPQGVGGARVGAGGVEGCWLVAGWDRVAAVHVTRTVAGGSRGVAAPWQGMEVRRGPPGLRPGVDGRGPQLLRPDGSTDTGMPVTSRRAAR